MFSPSGIAKKNNEALKKHEKEVTPHVYDQDNQHPDHTVSDWLAEACAKRTLLSYQAWVEEQLYRDTLPNDKRKVEMYEEFLNDAANWKREIPLDDSCWRARNVLILTGACPKEYRVKLLRTKVR